MPAALLGFDPQTGLELALIVLAMGIVGVAVYGYSPPTRRDAHDRDRVARVGDASRPLVACAMIATRVPAPLYAYDNGRAVGTFLNPNELAAYLLVVLGLAAGIALYARSAPLRLLAGVTLLAGLLALGATYSRWGLLVGRCRLRRSSRCSRGAAGSGSDSPRVVVAAVLLVLGPRGRRTTTRATTPRACVAWTTGLRTWLAFPLTGVGPFAFRRTYDVVRPPEAPGGEAPVAFDPHSLPLAYLDESGLVGFVALTVVLVGLRPRDSARAARRPIRAGARLVYALAGGLIALNVARAGEHDQHLLRACDARRGAGAGPGAAGPRCDRGLNCCWSRRWPPARTPAAAAAADTSSAAPGADRDARCRCTSPASAATAGITTLSEMKHQRTIYIGARDVVRGRYEREPHARPAAAPSIEPHITFVDRSGARDRRRRAEGRADECR